MSTTSKVFSRVILDRISEALDPLLRKEKAGFRKGKSCGDHIFTLRQILEQCQKWNTPFYANFVDFEKAFDSIHRDSLWRILRHYGIPTKIVSILLGLDGDRPLPEDATQATRCVVLQYDSVLLFLLYINQLDCNIKSNLVKFSDGTKVFRKVNNDDNKQHLQNNLDKLDKWSDKMADEFNLGKCKCQYTAHLDLDVNY